MNGMMGARNTRGFIGSVQAGYLPSFSHITCEGIFNQLKFPVGPKTQKILDLHLGYSRYHFSSSFSDTKIGDYLAIFLKSCKDGTDRDDIPLNAVISLDISGSMTGGLGEQRKQNLSRLKLSIEAIKMFISKLRSNDSIGITTFDSIGRVIFPSTLKGQIDEQKLFNQLDLIVAEGGTNVKNGFDISKKLLLDFLQKRTGVSENRIIMMTDVGDNSFQREKQFIQKTSTQQGINLSIVGISLSFRSDICQKLKNVKGFNYFCAINEQDIKKYIFQTFDFGFFPAASNIDISISAQGIKSLETFGSPDSEQVNLYNNNFSKPQTLLTISRVKSVFPSELIIENGTVYTLGGLILVKLDRDNTEGTFNGEIKLKYQTQKGEKIQQIYPLNYEFHPTQQFFTQQCLQKAIQGYTFVSEMRQLLKKSQKMKKHQIYENFHNIVKDLQNIVPQSKLKDYKNIVKIINDFKEQKKQEAQELN